MHDHDLLLVGSVIEDVAASRREREGENGWSRISSGVLPLHFLFKDLEGTEVKDVIGVHHTVLHVDRIVDRGRNVEHKRVVLSNAVNWIEDLLLWVRLDLKSTTVDVVDELATDIVAKSSSPLDDFLNGSRDTEGTFEAIIAK